MSEKWTIGEFPLAATLKMNRFRHAIRPDNRMDQTLFVRPVALQGVGSAMLHQGFISRASDVMSKKRMSDFEYWNKVVDDNAIEYGTALNEAYSNSGYVWNDEPKTPKRSIRPTFLYLIRHGRNGFHKIGISRKPQARERTLQAEDPELEMVGFWSATVADELDVHALFESKRVRGEWFRLNADDLKAFADFVATIQSKNSGQGGTKLDAPLALPEAKKENLRAPQALLKALVAGMRVEAK